ncbi:MAG TPA: phosphate regulon sensor histidine kinase PhoR [Woeseiaceae bacterium]|nr:phosphate regulon sensor histidine kinase PhoR [Woeseiaceae bacterium]
MPESWRRFLVGTIVLLAGATLIGWYYGHADWGLLLGSLAALAWHIRQLLVFDRALRIGDFELFRYGEGIWSQIFARFSFLKQRSRKHKRAYRQLLREVRESTNAMPDGGIVLNREFEIVLCNRAAEQLLNLNHRQDRGQRIDNLLRDPLFVEYLNSGVPEAGIEIPSPVQAGNWLLCRLVPYGGDQQLLFVRDITERKRLATMRREFVANASHELRSPLTVISGYLDTLAEDPDVPAAWRSPVAQMRSQATRMNNIVAELLELSRLEAPVGEKADQQVDVGALLASTRKAFAGSAKGPTLKVNCESRARIVGRQAEIESVVTNLLSNAMRHTPPDGSVTLTWRSSGDGAELVVADTGEGIAEEHIPRLTERFFRVDSGRSRDGGGIGLGLAIVKHALERHDAKLEIHSQFGKGSTFICHFPSSRLAADKPVPISSGAGTSR